MKERGVYKRRNGWIVSLKVNGTLTYFGTYSSLEEANGIAKLVRIENPKSRKYAEQREPYTGQSQHGVRFIQLADGTYTTVSEADYARLVGYYWWKNSSGYATTNIGGERVKMHHLVLGRKKNMVTDHINRNRLDNRRENLRLVSQSDNLRNVAARTPSGMKGVYRSGEKWRGIFKFNSNSIHVGSFSTKEEANDAVIAKKKEFGIEIF